MISTELRKELDRRYEIARRKNRLDTYFFWVSDDEREQVRRMMDEADERCGVAPNRMVATRLLYRGLSIYSPSCPPPGMRRQKWSRA